MLRLLLGRISHSNSNGFSACEDVAGAEGDVGMVCGVFDEGSGDGGM